MPVVSQRLAADATSGTGSRDIYTVPANRRTIIKSIVGINTSGAANRLFVNVIDGGVTITTFTLAWNADGTLKDAQWLQCWIVMREGEVLQVAAENASIHVLVSGAELVL